MLLASDEDPVKVERAWIAVAAPLDYQTTWLAIGTQGAGRLGMVVPFRSQARLDPSDRHLLAALESATAPRVLPPEGETLPACASEEPAVEVEIDALPETTIAPVLLETVSSLGALADVARAQGLSVSDAVLDSLGSAGPDLGALLLVYDAPDEAALTEPLRIQAPVGKHRLPFGSLRSAMGHDFPATFFAFGEQPLVVSGLTALRADDLDVSWFAATGTSDYRDERRRRLRAGDDHYQVVESARNLYEWETLPDDAGVIRSVARSYLDAAAGDVDLADDCAAAVVGVRQSGFRVARACAPGALASAPDAAEGTLGCGEATDDAPLDPGVLECDGADELAFIHSGLAPDVFVTRLSTWVTGASADAPRLVPGEEATDSTVVRADEVDSTDCETASHGAGGTSGGYPPSGTDPVASGSASAVSDEGCPTWDCSYTEVEVVVSEGPSCSGSTQPDDDYFDNEDEDDSGCTFVLPSDSSDDYDGETCSGDSSDDYDGETCSGDTSDDYDGETCSGDTSDDDYDGETCSGDTSDDYDGETCSVSRRRRKPRLSALSFILCALFMVTRRLRRPRYGE